MMHWYAMIYCCANGLIDDGETLIAPDCQELWQHFPDYRTQMTASMETAVLTWLAPRIGPLNHEQANQFEDEKQWKEWPRELRGLFQIHQPKLCMPFDHFKSGVEALLNRSVFSHELSDRNALIAEWAAKGQTPA